MKNNLILVSKLISEGFKVEFDKDSHTSIESKPWPPYTSINTISGHYHSMFMAKMTKP